MDNFGKEQEEYLQRGPEGNVKNKKNLKNN